MSRENSIIAALLIAFFASISAAFASTSHAELSNDRISRTDIVLGNKEAKLLIIEYFAPTCAHCSDYHLKVFPELKRKYIDTGKIAYVMRECVGNKQDFDASLLARCKGDTKSYRELTSNLLHTQDSWAYSKDYRENLYKIAKEHDVTKEQYDSCLSDESKSQILFDHAKLIGSDKDFIGTPSFYINGNLHKGSYDLNGLSDSIENELANKALHTELSNDAPHALKYGNTVRLATTAEVLDIEAQKLMEKLEQIARDVNEATHRE